MKHSIHPLPLIALFRRVRIFDSFVTVDEIPETASRSPLDRQLSTMSNVSSLTNDSVFTHDSPTRKPLAAAYCHVKGAVVRQDCSRASPGATRTDRHNDSMAPPRSYNPFPKPAKGLLSAEKAKVGIKLGLYKPQDALAYMTPSEQRQLLKDGKNFIGRIAVASRSNMW